MPILTKIPPVRSGQPGALVAATVIALLLTFDQGCNQGRATVLASPPETVQSPVDQGSTGGSTPSSGSSPLSAPDRKPSVDVSPAATGTPGADSDAFAEAYRITAQIAKINNEATDAMTFRAETVKPPYTWSATPQMYARILRSIAGQPGADAFWLVHCRLLAIPFARLSRALARDPDNPYEPDLLSMDTENLRGQSFDDTVKAVAKLVQQANPQPSRVVRLLEVILLIMCGDTRKATGMLDQLPALPDDPALRVERGLRLLARTMLAYSSKKPPRPIALMREALSLFDGHLGFDATDDDRGWGLILVYAAAPGLLDRGEAKPELGDDVVEKGLVLLGLTPRGGGVGAAGGRGLTITPTAVDPAVDTEVRRVIREAAHRALDPLTQDLTGQDPPKQKEIVDGLAGARWLVLAATPGKEEGPLWYSLYRDTLTAGGQLLGSMAVTDAGVKARLAALDEALAARQGDEETGLMSACRARLAQIRKDTTLASSAMRMARQKAGASGLKAREPAIFDSLAH